MNNIIKDINNPSIDTISYILNLPLLKLEKLILYCSDIYYNKLEPVISDDIYDLLIDILQQKNPKSNILSSIGSKNIKNKIKLDYWLGSMTKIKLNSNQLDIWIKKYNTKYNISDKLDGISALLVYNNNNINLYTRGNGNEGMDISNLVKYLSLPDYNSIINYCNKYNINGNKNIIALRGELVIKKNIYNKLWNTIFKNERSAVASIVNSKKINVKLINDIDLVIYEIIDPFYSIDKQFEYINKLNFKYAQNININNSIDYKYLSNILKERRQLSEYQIDGIIITSIGNYVRNTDGNPEYAFAYKDILDNQKAITIIETIEWNISKDGFLIPTIIIKPVEIGGIIIKRTTGFNAKYIVDNILGPNSEIEIIRSGDVIPYINRVIKSAKKPYLPDIKWHWNKTKVDIQIDNLTSNKNLLIKNIYHFFSILNTKGLGEKVITKIYNAGFNTVEKILNISKDELLTIETIKDKSANNILISINIAKENILLEKLMVASNKFGHGLGIEKIKLVTQKYPNILNDYKKWSFDEFINKIKILNKWEEKTATQFVKNFEKFIDFYNSIKKYIKIKKIIENEDKSLLDKQFVFSGFRDKKLELLLESKGAKINNSVSKNVNYVIIKNKESLKNPTTKIEMAQQYNIPIITIDELKIDK